MTLRTVAGELWRYRARQGAPGNVTLSRTARNYGLSEIR